MSARCVSRYDRAFLFGTRVSPSGGIFLKDRADIALAAHVTSDRTKQIGIDRDDRSRSIGRASISREILPPARRLYTRLPPICRSGVTRERARARKKASAAINGDNRPVSAGHRRRSLSFFLSAFLFALQPLFRLTHHHCSCSHSGAPDPTALPPLSLSAPFPCPTCARMCARVCVHVYTCFPVDPRSRRWPASPPPLHCSLRCRRALINRRHPFRVGKLIPLAIGKN